MFEKILSVTKNFAIVKISSNINDDILNYNVILEDKDKRVLGEMDEVINDEAKISFLGEFIFGGITYLYQKRYKKSLPILFYFLQNIGRFLPYAI